MLKTILNRYIFHTDRDDFSQKKFLVHIQRKAYQNNQILFSALGIVVLIFWPTDFLIFNNPAVLFWGSVWKISLLSVIILFLTVSYRFDLSRYTFLGIILSSCLNGFVIGLSLSKAFASMGFSSTNVSFAIGGLVPFATIVVNAGIGKRFLGTFLISSFFVGGYYLNHPINEVNEILISTGLTIVGGAIFISVITGHIIYTLFRENFFEKRQRSKAEYEAKQAQNRAEIAKRKSEELLSNILPEEISERLKAGEDVSEKFNDVTVLFADIVEFTPLANELPANEVVSILDELFSAFDDLVNKYGLEKIKTIGDEYFVAAGVPEPMENHATKMANLAFDMQEEVKKHKRNDGSPFRLRCGMHTGPLVAGIIGKEKFVYDVWGDTVNIGSRMESQGRPGKIQVTPSTKQRIEAQSNGKFSLEKRGTLEVKGKGSMTTYFLDKE